MPNRADDDIKWLIIYVLISRVRLGAGPNVVDRMCCCNPLLKANGVATAMLRRVAWVPALYFHRVARSDDSYLAAEMRFEGWVLVEPMRKTVAVKEWHHRRQCICIHSRCEAQCGWPHVLPQPFVEGQRDGNDNVAPRCMAFLFAATLAPYMHAAAGDTYLACPKVLLFPLQATTPLGLPLLVLFVLFLQATTHILLAQT